MKGRTLLAAVVLSTSVMLAVNGFLYLTAEGAETGNGTKTGNVTKRVFILLGQSNMEGCGKYWEYSPAMRKGSKDITILRNSQWVPMIPNQKYNGPEISFAYEMKRFYKNDSIAIIKVATGGAGIRAFLPDWDSETADVSEDAYHGSLYKKLKQQIDFAKEDPNVVFCGVLWKQGEKDMIKKQYAEGYMDYLKEIIAQIREDTATPELPLFIATYFDVETVKGLLEAGMYSDREAALDITWAHNMAENEIDNTYVIRHGTLPVTADGLHFSTEGLVRLGYMFAEEVKKGVTG